MSRPIAHVITSVGLVGGFVESVKRGLFTLKSLPAAKSLVRKIIIFVLSIEHFYYNSDLGRDNICRLSTVS